MLRFTLALAFLSTPIFAETRSYPPFSGGCTGSQSNYSLYRCICRASLANASGSSVTSVPLQVNGTSTFVFSASNSLNGTACQGTLASDPCNPPILNGAIIHGTWTCALGTTTSDGGFTIQ